MVEFKRMYGKMDKFMSEDAFDEVPEVAAMEAIINIINTDPEVKNIISETEKRAQMQEEQRESVEDQDEVEADGEGEMEAEEMEEQEEIDVDG
jgi:DNA modification methylase